MPVLRAARKRETALEPLSGGVPTRPGGEKPRRPRSLALVARAKTNDMESWKITQVLEKTVGEGGIRTLGSSRINGFQDRRLRPLSHLSGRCASITDPEAHPRNRAGSGCCGEAGAETFHPCGHPPLPSPRVPVSVTAGYAPPPHRPLLLPGRVDPFSLPLEPAMASSSAVRPAGGGCRVMSCGIGDARRRCRWKRIGGQSGLSARG